MKTPNNSNGNKMATFDEGHGLQIPVIDMSSAGGTYLAQPEIIRDSLLELICTPQDLKSLVIAKPDDRNQDITQLNNIDFGDDIARGVVFSSGKNVYFGDENVIKKIRGVFFGTQPDQACRYGSLLVSSCDRGALNFYDSKDSEPLRIKIVDSSSDNPEEKALAQRFFTGDCHGKISPQLAILLKADRDRPFQFRFAWMQQWGKENFNCPTQSFLAKGTFLPNKTLTTDAGYDIILDRTSIKGFERAELEKAIPCGDYQLPRAAIGNRSNARAQDYENSWQFSIWFSKEALQKDIVPATVVEAQKLAVIQKDPLLLSKYLIERHDRREDLRVAEDGTEEIDRTPNESKFISIMRSDRLGLLAGFPKLVDFQRSQLKKLWLNLALKGAVSHGSAMAQPCEDLKEGTIVAPHLDDGEEVIVTRYPIVSKDNIRRYTVDNSQPAARSLLHYKGCAFIRPDQAMEHHQCDFDGDQLVISYASKFPNIAKEIRHANEPAEFAPIAKQPKVKYGLPQYKNLREVAVGINNNNIGYIATLIGRVQSSVNETDSSLSQKRFARKKEILLDRLFNALQIEVDSPKSSVRHQDNDPDIATLAKKWSERYSCSLFDFKGDERVYRTATIPITANNNINCIVEAVNDNWMESKLTARNRDEYRFLFAPPDEKEALTYWKEELLPWAETIKERFRETAKQIYETGGNNGDYIKEEFGKCYTNLRGEIEKEFPDTQERMLAASALWHLETTNTNLEESIRESRKLSRQLDVTFNLEKDYQLLHDLIPKNTWVLSVPFERYLFDCEALPAGDRSSGKVKTDERGQPQTQLLAQKFKEYLDDRNIKYEAVTSKEIPVVQFALIDPDDKTIEKLNDSFGENLNDIATPFTYKDNRGTTKFLRIVAPKEYNWVSNEELLTPKSSLVLNLFAPEISQQLENYQFSRAKLVGQRFNDFSEEDFKGKKWQGKTVELTVGTLDNPNDYRHGSPIVQLDGKNLAMFSADSPKLPIGSTFTGSFAVESTKTVLVIDVEPESVEVPIAYVKSPSKIQQKLLEFKERYQQSDREPKSEPKKTLSKVQQKLLEFKNNSNNNTNKNSSSVKKTQRQRSRKDLQA
jgi:hypothetical protein